MESDLVKGLRKVAGYSEHGYVLMSASLLEAADAIEALQRENEGLKQEVADAKESELAAYGVVKLHMDNTAQAEAHAAALRSALENLTERVEMCNRGVAEYIELVGLAGAARDALNPDRSHG